MSNIELINNNRSFGIAIGLTPERCMYVELAVNDLIKEAITAIDKNKAKSTYVYLRITENFPDLTERGYAHFQLGWFSCAKHLEKMESTNNLARRKFLS